jgi:hypothetical protein
MKLELKIQQVIGLPNGMVRLILLRRGLKARIEPIPQTEEQRIAQNVISQIQQSLGTAFPGAVIVGGHGSTSGQWDARIDMEITQEEYEELGKPSIGDAIVIDLSKLNTTHPV